MNVFLRSASVLALFAAALAASAQNIVQNGDFETGNLSPWTATGNLIDCTRNGVGFSTYYVRLGTENVEGTLSQNLATTTGTLYKVEFDLYSEASANSRTHTFRVDFGGLTGYSLTNPGPIVPAAHFSFNAIATGSSTLLQFAARNDPDYWRLDNVSVTAVNPTPEPATMAALGLGAVAFVKRRKRA